MRVMPLRIVPRWGAIRIQSPISLGVETVPTMQLEAVYLERRVVLSVFRSCSFQALTAKAWSTEVPMWVRKGSCSSRLPVQEVRKSQDSLPLEKLGSTTTKRFGPVTIPDGSACKVFRISWMVSRSASSRSLQYAQFSMCSRPSVRP